MRWWVINVSSVPIYIRLRGLLSSASGLSSPSSSFFDFFFLLLFFFSSSSSSSYFFFFSHFFLFFFSSFSSFPPPPPSPNYCCHFESLLPAPSPPPPPPPGQNKTGLLSLNPRSPLAGRRTLNIDESIKLSVPGRSTSGAGIAAPSQCVLLAIFFCVCVFLCT